MLEKINDSIKIGLWLQKFWEKRTTIALLLFVIFSSGVFIFYNIDFNDIPKKITLQERLSLLFVLIIIFLAWFITRRPAKANKNKIGIAVAIVCETKKERQRLKMEFIDALKNEIQKGNHQQFDIVELSEYHASKIDPKKSIEYHIKTRSHMLIFGKCRIREHTGKPHYVLDLDISVSHRPIPQELSSKFGREMIQIFPKKTLIPLAQEVVGFSVTQDIIGYGARYVLGTASLISRFPDVAFDFHYNLWKDITSVLEKQENAYPGYKAIKKALPEKIVEEALILTRLYYKLKPHGYLIEMGKYLEVLREIDPNNYAGHLLRGMYFFLHFRDIEKAKTEIKKSKNDRDASWQFSDAFLCAYEGNLDQAHKIYKRAFQGYTDPIVPFDVETFIIDVLDQEPDKIQLWYCLGMINYFDKGDLPSAKRDFLKFIESTNNGQFETSVKFAKKYISEIDGRTIQKVA